MKEYKIEVIIDEDGNLKAETFGMTGTTCVDELDSLLAGLEGDRSEKYTPDYYKKVKQTVRKTIPSGRK